MKVYTPHIISIYQQLVPLFLKINQIFPITIYTRKKRRKMNEKFKCFQEESNVEHKLTKQLNFYSPAHSYFCLPIYFRTFVKVTLTWLPLPPVTNLIHYIQTFVSILMHSRTDFHLHSFAIQYHLYDWTDILKIE